MKDTEIIALFFERSEQAIAELMRKYGTAIRSVVSNILRDAQDVEECSNDTYLQVWNQISPTRPQYLGAYVCRIARNLSLKRHESNTAKLISMKSQISKAADLYWRMTVTGIFKSPWDKVMSPTH